jgi:signal transduction histidine kinase
MAEHLQEYRNSSLGELLLAQQASKAAIDSTPDPVIVFAAEGGVLQMNREAESLAATGRNSPNQDFLSRLAPQIREPLENARLHVLKGRGPYLPQGLEEAIAIAGAGGQRWLLVRATPVYQESGSIAGATVILQDVTRLHRFDELKNDLVATVAHEFRTPLTSLRMAIHLCLEGLAGPITDKQTDLLQASREDCQRLQTTVDELLDLARIQSGRFEMHPRSMPSNLLVENAVESFQAQADDKQVQLDSDTLLPREEVVADQERIHLVFSNLITNAIRHTPAGGTVHLGAVVNGDVVRFTVQDSGEGIAPEHQAAIFERFYRVPNAASGAVGLGLPLTRDIVQAHGGAIGVHSQPGAGSTFWFTLPLAKGRTKS